MVLMRLGIAGDDPDSQQAVITEVRQALTARLSRHPVPAGRQRRRQGLERAGRRRVLAVVLSFIGIMIYVWLRFEWQFALGAVVSLVHDAILVVGIFCLLQLEFNLTIVAAILTVIGYSINDTVVVFDRVREVLRKYKKHAAARRAEPRAQRDAEPHGDDVADDADRARRDLSLRRAAWCRASPSR